MKEYSLLGRSGLAWQSSLPKLQKNNIQAKVTTLRTEMKSKACSFLRKETASSQTSNNVTELYLFFLQSWFHLCGGADNTLLLVTYKRLAQRCFLMLNTMNAPCASVSKALMMLPLLEGPFSPGELQGSILAEINAQQKLTRPCSMVGGCWQASSLKDFIYGPSVCDLSTRDELGNDKLEKGSGWPKRF